MLLDRQSANYDSVIAKLNETGNGIVFFTDNNSISGCLTDGDLRRSMREGTALQDCINNNFVTAKTKAEAKQKLRSNPGLKAIPVIQPGKPTDIVTLNELISFNLVSQRFNGNEADYLNECLETGWISSQGRFVNLFEENFNNYCHTNYSVATSNGTSALHLALLALGIGEGDEVIVPDVTFAATINSVIYVGATPVIADVDEYGVLTESSIEENISKKTKAVIFVHLYGWVGEIDKISRFIKANDLLLIEDCAEALGSECNGVRVGSFGDAASFSFFGNKTITTGEGGMVCFQEEKHSHLAKKYRDHGMNTSKRYWHDVVGYNYRMTNLQAAIGVAQLERVEDIINQKISLANLYDKYFKNNKDITIPPSSNNARNTYWIYTVSLKRFDRTMRDSLLDNLSQRKIEVRPAFYCMSEMPIYKKYSNKLNLNAREYSDKTICLPSSIDLNKENIGEIASILFELI